MKPKAVQPDYEKWQAVEIGMGRDQVIEILGQPRKDEYLAANSPHLNYGFLQLPFCPHSRTYLFLIVFDNDGKVCTKEDPFNGRFSSDGSPTKPELIIPIELQEYSHYPRVMDIRWYPVSGVYPITYTVELGTFPFPEVDGAPPDYDWNDQIVESELIGPYLVTSFPDAGPGRLRVKAQNNLGESEWSDYRTFRFNV